MKKVKTIAKYTTNILGMIAALLLGFNAIEGINIPFCHQIVEGIAVVQGVIATYLLGGKLFSENTK